jgi:O-antigen/teichoic acid export membrane protein
MEQGAARDVLDTRQAGPTAIRGSALRVSGYIAGVALSVVSAALLLRYLGPRDFGRYAAIIALVTIIGGVTEAGMSNIGVREWAVRADQARARLLGSLLGLRIALTLAGVVVGLGFGVIAGYESALIAGIALGGAGLVAQLCQGTYQVPLQSELRLGWVTALDLVRQGVTVAGIVLLVLIGAGLVPFFVVPIAAGMVSTIATVPLVAQRVPLLPSFDLAEWRKLLAVTLPYAVATAAGLLYAYLSVVLMSLVASELETGYYAASFRIFIVVTAIPGLLVSSTFPILARAATADRRRLAYGLQRLFDVALIFGTGLALLVSVGAEVAIDVVAGPDFDPAVSVLQIHGTALLSTFLAATWSFALLALGRYRALLVANALALLISAGLTLALAPEFGAEGAAVATLIGESGLALAAGIAVFGDVSLRPSLETVRPTLLALVVAVAVALVPGLPVAARAVGTALAYAAVIAALGALPTELREAFGAGSRRGAE